MSSFTVRVELHGASETHYNLLHTRMQAHGYYRAIVMNQTATGKDMVFALPTAEYDHSSDRTAIQVRDEVYGIAAAIKGQPTPWVLVTEVKSRALMTEVLRAANAA